MFLHAMTKEERVTFVGLAKALVEADGVAHEAEKEMLRTISLEAGAALDDVSPRALDDTLPNAFATSRSRRAVVFELLGIAYADGSLHRGESTFIGALARQFSIAEEELIWMERWVARQLALASEAERFLEQGMV